MFQATPCGRILTKLVTFVNFAKAISIAKFHVDDDRSSNFTVAETDMFPPESEFVLDTAMHYHACMSLSAVPFGTTR